MRVRELGDGLRRQRRELQAADGALRGELAERSPQRMTPLELVVAVREKNECRHVLDLAAQDAQYVQCRLIRPVNVLEDDDGRSVSSECSHECAHELVQLAALREVLGKVSPDALGDVEQRSQGSRREEWIACTPEDRRAVQVLIAEVAEERRLA